MTVVLDPVDVFIPADVEPLVHWTIPPHTHGICGRPLTIGLHDFVEVTCVVCIDLAGGRT